MGVCEMTVKRTRLCYWIARPAKPGVQSSNTSQVRFTVISHTLMRSRFYHTHTMYKRNWDDFCLVNLIYFELHIFQIAICIVVLMNRGETCYLKRRDLVTVWRTMLLLCCYHCDCMQQHYDVTQFEYVLWCHTMHEWVMNIHYKTWIAQGRFTNMILTPRYNGACVIMAIVTCAIVVLHVDTFLHICRNKQGVTNNAHRGTYRLWFQAAPGF